MPPESYDRKRTTRGLLLLVAVYLIVVYTIPRPAAVKPEGWRLAGIFFATVAGLIAQPLSGGPIVLIGVTPSAVLGLVNSGLGRHYPDPAVFRPGLREPERMVAHRIRGKFVQPADLDDIRVRVVEGDSYLVVG